MPADVHREQLELILQEVARQAPAIHGADFEADIRRNLLRGIREKLLVPVPGRPNCYLRPTPEVLEVLKATWTTTTGSGPDHAVSTGLIHASVSKPPRSAPAVPESPRNPTFLLPFERVAIEREWTKWLKSRAASCLYRLIKDWIHEALKKDPEPFRPLWDQCQAFDRLVQQVDPGDNEELWEVVWASDFPTGPEAVTAFAENAAKEFCTEKKIPSEEVYHRAVEFYRVVAETVHRVWPLILSDNDGFEELIPAPSAPRRWEFLVKPFISYLNEPWWDIWDSEATFPSWVLGPFSPATPPDKEA